MAEQCNEYIAPLSTRSEDSPILCADLSKKDVTYFKCEAYTTLPESELSTRFEGVLPDASTPINGNPNNPYAGMCNLYSRKTYQTNYNDLHCSQHVIVYPIEYNPYCNEHYLIGTENYVEIQSSCQVFHAPREVKVSLDAISTNNIISSVNISSLYHAVLAELSMRNISAPIVSSSVKLSTNTCATPVEVKGTSINVIPYTGSSAERTNILKLLTNYILSCNNKYNGSIHAANVVSETEFSAVTKNEFNQTLPISSISDLSTKITGTIVSENSTSSLINTVNSVIQDCICYSDCGEYSVCYCYGNCRYY